MDDFRRATVYIVYNFNLNQCIIDCAVIRILRGEGVASMNPVDCYVFTRCTGKVNAYVELYLDPSQLVECKDDLGRDIFLYPENDLQIKSDMKAQLGFTD